MKLRSTLVATALFATSTMLSAAPPAPAGPDLALSLAAPAGPHVYETRRYTYTIRNVGPKASTGGQIVVTLPQTGTSPEVYILGAVAGYSAGCTLAGRTLTCPLPNLNKNASTTKFIDVSLPLSTRALVVDATVTTAGDQSAANNRVIHTANLLTYPVTMSLGVPVTHQHCTGGPTLSSYLECTLFPSSVTEHDAIFNAVGTITFVDAPASYSGFWNYIPSENRLHFEYFDGSLRVAEFDGRGVPGNCFEGITTFPNSPNYISPYRLCMP